jgi:cytidine deaminase
MIGFASRRQLQRSDPNQNMTSDSRQDLCRRAESVAQNAYAPYSGFKVGAAVRTNDGSIFVGANVENATFGATVCAERVALGAALSHGHREIVALALFARAEGSNFHPSELVPCGICLQWLAELAPEAEIVVCGPDTPSVRFAGELLARPFLTDPQ